MHIEKLSPNRLSSLPAFDDHEEVYVVSDRPTGLKAVIALHNTILGPAAGGCRFWTYANDEDALRDALRLSKAMSFKNAMAGLPLGGGKAVVWSERPVRDRTAFFSAFGRAVQSLKGRYITAEDVGTRTDDMIAVARETNFVAGLPAKAGRPGGNPSPRTAHGVFLGIAAAVKFALARTDLSGTKVAVQGLGSVGYALCKELHAADASLVVADLDDDRVQRAVAEFSAKRSTPEAVLFEDVDVAAPCALGGILNKETIPQLRAKIVAGAANNQLDNDHDGELLRLRGVLYAPDYVINAGGIIQVAAEYLGWSEDDVNDRLKVIPMSLQQIFEESNWRHLATNTVADTLAQTKLNRHLPARAAG